MLLFSVLCASEVVQKVIVSPLSPTALATMDVTRKTQFHLPEAEFWAYALLRAFVEDDRDEVNKNMQVLSALLEYAITPQKDAFNQIDYVKRLHHYLKKSDGPAFREFERVLGGGVVDDPQNDSQLVHQDAVQAILKGKQGGKSWCCC